MNTVWDYRIVSYRNASGNFVYELAEVLFIGDKPHKVCPLRLRPSSSAVMLGEQAEALYVAYSKARVHDCLRVSLEQINEQPG